MEIKRSPFFYVGDKYKLMPQLKTLFPRNIGTYYEPFCGGGSSFLNTTAAKYIVNDIDLYVIKLHQLFQENANRIDDFISELYSIIQEYELSCSYLGNTVPDELKKKHVKTYYARYNKDAYTDLRRYYNLNQENMKVLYLLLIYGFNHMIRFNSKGVFNLPVGNVDFNANVHKAICGYAEFLQDNDIVFCNHDFQSFINSQKYNGNDFVFCDPPYLISQSEYNKLWNEKQEIMLYQELDKLDKKGVRFGLTNLLNHKGRTNQILCEWMSKYKVYPISSNYISYNDNTIKSDSKEVFVTNG